MSVVDGGVGKKRQIELAVTQTRTHAQNWYAHAYMHSIRQRGQDINHNSKEIRKS